jgi:hypothetical protein
MHCKVLFTTMAGFQATAPLEYQDWYAGNIDLATATERLKHLPTGVLHARRPSIFYQIF